MPIFERFVLFMFLLFAFMGTSNGQSPVFTQYYATTSWHNPAWSGNLPSSRLTLNYRNEFPKIQNGLTTTRIAYDSSMPDLHSGLAVQLIYQNLAQLYAVYTSQLSYSYNVNIDRNLQFSLGVGMYFQQAGWQRSNITLPSSLLSATPTLPEGLATENNQQYGMNTGFLVGNKKFHAGISVSEISFAQNDWLPMRLNAHFGTNFDIIRGQRKFFRITPVFRYHQQYAHKFFATGVYARLPYLTGGLETSFGINKPISLSLMLGFQYSNIIFAYSNETRLSQTYLPEIHELSLIYEFKPKKKKRTDAISCPSL